MTETKLVEKLLGHIRSAFPGFVVFKIADRFTAGIPDIQVHGNRISSVWEVKFADPDFASNGIQELTMRRLEHAGIPAFYIIFGDDGTKTTRIVHPKDFQRWELTYEATGWDFQFIIDKIAEVHRVAHL